MTAADLLWFGLLAVPAVSLVVLAAAADKRRGPKQGERPLFGDPDENARRSVVDSGLFAINPKEERDREQ
jgi:hypothetical protein